jgi:phospholipid/cholesterol/gamma-HCH transport system substrate-binding protein
MATPARLVGVGIFVLGGLLLFTLGLFMIGSRQMLFAKKFVLYTEFKKITGLQPGAIVRVSGARPERSPKSSRRIRRVRSSG